MPLPKNRRWMWYLLPSQVTAQGLCTVIPLFVIFLGGGIGEVAIIVAFQNGTAALGSIFWGKVIDRFHLRRAVILVSFFALLLCSVSMYFTKNIDLLYVISPILGFFLVGRNPITQLLVMESAPKKMWSWLFARTSIISTFGMLVAMLIGTVGSKYFDLRPYFLICAASSGLAMALSMNIKRPEFHLEPSSVAHSIQSLRYGFSHLHFVFPKIPEIHDFKHIIIMFKGKISDEIAIFYIANFFFYFGSNIYFTAFTPFLKSFHFSDSAVFLIYMIQTATMLAVFFIVPRLISKIGEERATTVSYVPRISGILIAALFIPFIEGNAAFIGAIASSSIMVLGFSIFSTSSSVIFFKSIPQGFEGKYLGVNSSVTGFGFFIGALITGELTKLFGYTASFVVSSAILVVSFLLFQAYFSYKLSRKII